MKDKLIELQEVLSRFEDECFKNMGKLSQFTIDFVQNESYAAGDFGGDDEAILDHIGSLSYQVSTILEVIKDGDDKQLLERLQNAIKELDEYKSVLKKLER